MMGVCLQKTIFGVVKINGKDKAIRYDYTGK